MEKLPVLCPDFGMLQKYVWLVLMFPIITVSPNPIQDRDCIRLLRSNSFFRGFFRFDFVSHTILQKFDYLGPHHFCVD